MTMIALGFALGLSAAAPEAQIQENPHLLEADRVYQELIYSSRRLYSRADRNYRHAPSAENRPSQADDSASNLRVER